MDLSFFKSLPKKVVLSYILDYVIIGILILGFYALDAVEPYHQHFSLRNYTLQYPHAFKERIPIPLALGLSGVIPAIIIAIYALAIDGIFSHQNSRHSRSRTRYTFKERLWELNCGVLGLGLSQGLAFVITAVLKNATGKPRPDLIDRCRPKAGSEDLPIFGLSNSTICEPLSRAILKDGFRSFPSGHSSASFAGLFYLSLYLTGKLHLLDTRGEVWKAFVVMVPTLGAALIAISRIMDARHHPFDVLSGSLLGIMVAWLAYRQYFPPVSESWRKGRAYPIRTWASGPRNPRPEERQMAIDQGVEPLRRRSTHRTDEEQSPRLTRRQASYAEPADPGENVFRQQLSKSQRLRRNERAARGEPDSSTELDPRSPPTSFSPLNIRRKRVQTAQSDGHWSSTSSDHELSEDGIELRRPRRRSTAPALQKSDIHPAHRLDASDFEQDTSYHSRIQSPKEVI